MATQFIILACRICGVYEAPLTSPPLRQDIATFPLTSSGGAVWETRTTGFAVKRLDWMTGRLASLSKDKFAGGRRERARKDWPTRWTPSQRRRPCKKLQVEEVIAHDHGSRWTRFFCPPGSRRATASGRPPTAGSVTFESSCPAKYCCRRASPAACVVRCMPAPVSLARTAGRGPNDVRFHATKAVVTTHRHGPAPATCATADWCAP